MRLIGRETELLQLERFYASDKAEFLAIYGRRRVGKSFLIQAFYSKKSAVNFHVTGLKDGKLSEQIEVFTRVIGKTFYNGAELKNESKWLDVFEQLTRAIEKVAKNKKIILFFDELPWMATKKSKIIQALDHYWNRYWSTDPRIKLIACGSAASWIIENLIHNKGGLYNRITHQIELMPLTLCESKKFLTKKGVKLNNSQVLKLYMVMGGVPLYLDQVSKTLSVDQNIDEICFTRRGLLFNEFNKLFASLFEQKDVHEELIRIIASNRYGISQIDLMKKSSKSVGGRLKKRLQELEDAGFVESFIPYQHKEKGIYFRVLDEYTLFYLKWLDPVWNKIKRRDSEKGYWLSKQHSQSWCSWSGYVFEAICFKHLRLIRKKLNITPGAEAGSWRYVPRKLESRQGAQIDLLFDREDDAITLCEIKHTLTPFTIDKAYAKALQEKVTVFKDQTNTSKQVFVSMIASSGIKRNLYADDLISTTVTLDDLFKEQ
jgi:uncharacterized protein